MVWRVEWAFRQVIKRFSGQRGSTGVRMMRLQSIEPHNQRLGTVAAPSTGWLPSPGKMYCLGCRQAGQCRPSRNKKTSSVTVKTSIFMISAL